MLAKDKNPEKVVQKQEQQATAKFPLAVVVRSHIKLYLGLIKTLVYSRPVARGGLGGL